MLSRTRVQSHQDTGPGFIIRLNLTTPASTELKITDSKPDCDRYYAMVSKHIMRHKTFRCAVTPCGFCDHMAVPTIRETEE